MHAKKSRGNFDSLSTVVDWVRYTGSTLRSLSVRLTHLEYDYCDSDEEERTYLESRTSETLGSSSHLPSCPGFSELGWKGVHMVDGEMVKILTSFPGLTRLVISGLYVEQTDFEVAHTLIRFLTVLDFG